MSVQKQSYVGKMIKNYKYFVIFISLIVFLLFDKKVMSSNDTTEIISNDSIRTSLFIQSGFGINLNKTGGINVGIDLIYGKNHLAIFSGVEFWGTEYKNLQKIDFKDYFQKIYTMDIGLGPIITYKKFEFINLLGLFAGYGRVKEVLDDREEFYKAVYDYETVLGLVYKSLITYKISSKLKAGLLFSVKYNEKYTYTGTQIYLSYTMSETIKQKRFKNELNKTAKNAIYFELAGNALVYSINYDWIIVDKEYLRTSLRLGISALPSFFINNQSTYYPIIPIEINQLFGMIHCFEIGYGITMAPIELYQDEIEHLLRIGYRRQKRTKGFLFRAGLLGIIDFENYAIIPFSLGIGIGKNF